MESGKLQKVGYAQSNSLYSATEQPLNEDDFWNFTEIQNLWEVTSSENMLFDDFLVNLNSDSSSYPQPKTLDAPFTHQTSSSPIQSAYFSQGNVDPHQQVQFANSTVGFYDLSMSGVEVAPVFCPFSAAMQQQAAFLYHQQNNGYYPMVPSPYYHWYPAESTPPLSGNSSPISIEAPETPLSPDFPQAPVSNHIQKVKQVESESHKVESLFINGNKQLSSAFANMISYYWGILGSKYYSERSSLPEAIEETVQLLERHIDNHKISSPKSQYQPYRLNNIEIKSAKIIKDFVRALIPALMEYYKINYKGNHRFEVNDTEYVLAEKKYSVHERFDIAVNYYKPGSLIARPFLTIGKP